MANLDTVDLTFGWGGGGKGWPDEWRLILTRVKEFNDYMMKQDVHVNCALLTSKEFFIKNKILTFPLLYIY